MPGSSFPSIRSIVCKAERDRRLCIGQDRGQNTGLFSVLLDSTEISQSSMLDSHVPEAKEYADNAQYLIIEYLSKELTMIVRLTVRPHVSLRCRSRL